MNGQKIFFGTRFVINIFVLSIYNIDGDANDYFLSSKAGIPFS